MQEKTAIDSYIEENFVEPEAIEFSFEKIEGTKYRVKDYLQNDMTLYSFKDVKKYLEHHRTIARKQHRRLIVTDVQRRIRATSLVEIDNLLQNCHDKWHTRSRVNRGRLLENKPYLKQRKTKKIDERIYERNY